MQHSETSDFTLFFKLFDKKNNMTNAQKQLIIDNLKVSRIDRNTHVLQPGMICKEIHFVVEGHLRSYFVDSEKNNTINFYSPGSFITDMPCLTDASPARWGICSHNKGVLLSVNIYTWRKLCDENPYINNAFIAMLIKQLEKANKLGYILRGCTTEESIMHLKELHPGILNIMPQIHLASYLKVTGQAMSSVIKSLK